MNTLSRALNLLFVLCLITLSYGQESVEEAAILARELVDFSEDAIGTMATVYPEDHDYLSGQPFSLQEYYASCHENGSLTLLFMPISRHSQNIIHHRSHSASISISSSPPSANKARVSLIGNVTIFDDINATPDREEVEKCYVATHKDAKWWLPGPREPHVAYWARFDPHSVYYVGGFGSEHYIGYIPLELYQSASSLELYDCEEIVGDEVMDDNADEDDEHTRTIGIGGRLLVQES
ncbi:pyridoxamine 5'-phosphate oxidase-domain-containing protein [Abortiporus biennis]|nr:pyridoxamine 5'-phosphate oxidase-domain-containing protein [Abortiporus biennis]